MPNGGVPIGPRIRSGPGTHAMAEQRDQTAQVNDQSATGSGDQPVTGTGTPSSPDGTEPARRDWQVAAGDLAPEATDPLLGSLLILARHFGRQQSAAAVVAGLPLEDNRLSPSQFSKAARQAGLSARLVACPLKDIAESSLPSILLLKDRLACVLLRRTRDGQVEVQRPESGDGVETMEEVELARIYTGYAFHLRPLRDLRVGSQESEPSTGDASHSGWRRYWGTYLHVGLATLLVNLLALALPLFLMRILDQVIPAMAIPSLRAVAIGLGLVFLFDLLLRLVRDNLVADIAWRTDAENASALFARLLRMKLSHRPGSSGAFAHRLAGAEKARDAWPPSLTLTLVDLPFVLIFLVALWRIGGDLVWVPILALAALLPVLALVQAGLRSRVARADREAAAKMGLAVECLTSLDTIKTLNVEGRLQREWDDRAAAAARHAHQGRRLSELARRLSLFAGQMVVLLVVFLAAPRVMDHQLSPGALVACALLAAMAMAPLGRLTQVMSDLNRALEGRRTSQEIAKIPSDRPAEKVTVRRPLIRGGIEFRDVRFAYPGSDIPVLNGGSFRIQPGERVGIIGPVGSGKTTIARLIAGLYEPEDGAVLLDGLDPREMAPADVRRHVGLMMQDVILLDGTVWDNIAMGAPQADDAMILHAARLAGVDQFVERHPRGFDMMVGEHGAALSGGQRQSVALARALLSDPRILILDEPTSAVDLQAERDFVARLRDELGSRTVILISHRPSLFSLVDRLIVLGNGKIVADGPRDKILQLGQSAKETQTRDSGAHHLRPRQTPLILRRRSADPAPETDPGEAPDG